MSARPRILLWFSNAVMVVTGGLMLYALAGRLLHQTVFPVRAIRIEGTLQHVTRDQIGLIVKEDLSGNIFTVDIARLQAAFGQLPWVRHVDISRRWPDQLVVNLEEQQAAARWGENGLVNPYGEVFQAAANTALPELDGPPQSAPRLLQEYGIFAHTLAPLQLKPVRLALSPRRAWALTLSNGLTIKLGRDQAEQRLARFVQVYPQLMGTLKAPPIYVDLRYTSGFAMRLAATNKQTAKQTVHAPTAL